MAVRNRPHSRDITTPRRGARSGAASAAFATWAAHILAQMDRLAQQAANIRRATAPRPAATAPASGASPSAWLFGEESWLPAGPKSCGPAWSAVELLAACALKGILCDEAWDGAAPYLVLARHGETTLFRLRPGLAPIVRTATLAHALGHVYLGHGPRVCANGVFDAGDERILDAELAASIWAAHCLVRPSCDEELGAGDHGHADVAISSAARRLGVPPTLVRLWLRHRDRRYPELPHVWLRHP